MAYAAWNEEAQNYSEARASYLKVLERDKKNAEGMLGLARIDQAYGRLADSDAQLSKALKLHPKDPKVLVAVGQVHASRREWDAALEKMRAAHEAAPYETVYEYHLAVIEARSGDLTHAMEHFTRSLGQAEAHYNIGYILQEQGNTAEAQLHLVKALKLNPELKQAQDLLVAIRTNDINEVQPAGFQKSAH